MITDGALNEDSMAVIVAAVEKLNQLGALPSQVGIQFL